MRKLNESLSQQPESSQNSTTRAATFTQVMGEDRRGWVRTFGLGVTPFDIYGPRASIAEARAAAAEAQAAAVESVRIAEMERAQRIALQEEVVWMRTQLNQLMTWMQSFTRSGQSSSSFGPVFGATPNDIQRDGCCWAFSSTGVMEGINAITAYLISLSEQELVDCDSTNYECDGGYMDYAFECVIQNGGIDSELNYPYTGEDGRCNITKEETKVVTIDGYIDAEKDSALLCAVVKQPISVGIDGSALDFQL